MKPGLMAGSMTEPVKPSVVSWACSCWAVAWVPTISVVAPGTSVVGGPMLTVKWSLADRPR
jgi:hypothetical protein